MSRNGMQLWRWRPGCWPAMAASSGAAGGSSAAQLSLA